MAVLGAEGGNSGFMTRQHTHIDQRQWRLIPLLALTPFATQFNVYIFTESNNLPLL